MKRLLVLILVPFAAAADAQYSVEFLPVANADTRGIEKGVIVGNAYDGAGVHAFMWLSSSLRPILFTQSNYIGIEVNGIGGSEQVGFGQEKSSARNHALMWKGTALSLIDLHPSGMYNSQASRTDGQTQVGWATATSHWMADAHLWRGTAASAVNLHPPGADHSEARDVDGDFQVGLILSMGAALWRGTAESLRVLPVPENGFTKAANAIHGNQVVGFAGEAILWDLIAWKYVLLGPGEALDTNGIHQVGFRNSGFNPQAFRWSGTANSALNLHAYLPPLFEASIANAIDHNGTIVGWARYPTGGFTVPVVWRPIRR